MFSCQLINRTMPGLPLCSLQKESSVCSACNISYSRFSWKIVAWFERSCVCVLTNVIEWRERWSPVEGALSLDLGLRQAFLFSFSLIRDLRKVIYSLLLCFMCKEVDNTSQLFWGVFKYAVLKGLLNVVVWCADLGFLF